MKVIKLAVIYSTIMLFSACSNSEYEVADNQDSIQEIALRVSSTGDGLSTRAGRPLYSSEAAQDVDNVVIYIKDADNKVVYVHKIDNWKEVGYDYSDGIAYSYKLTGEDKLTPGSYTLHAYGYSNDGQTPTLPVKGESLENNLDVDFAISGAEEIFSGQTNLVVAGSPATFTGESSVTLYRQVAGSIGYFTKIPATVNGANTQFVRLVASAKNSKITFGANSANEINGNTPIVDNFIVYSINIANWFPEGDSDNNGFLDKGDTWNKAIGEGFNSLEGTIFGSSFLVPFEVVSNKNTFVLQLLDATGAVTKSWNVKLPVANVQQGESVDSYSIFRNQLYTIGEKSLGNPTDPTKPNPGDKEDPEDLSKDQDIAININDNWEVVHRLELD